jgi:ABC-type multidrug transport system ATPase subunit
VEHLDFVASAYRGDFHVRASYLLPQFELKKTRHRAQELSRGMRQKVGVCAHIRTIRRPLFDEPLTGLDPRESARSDSVRQLGRAPL